MVSNQNEKRRTKMDEKAITVKELKTAGDVLGKHTRDLLNQNLDIKQRIAYFESLRDAVAVAVRVASEDLANSEKLKAEQERLTVENASLERTRKALSEDTNKVKTEWQAQTVKLESVRQDVAALESKAEGLRVFIERAEHTRQVLAELGTH